MNLDLGLVMFDCVKKICKKYRYMMRSDDLYREMLYVIEQASATMLTWLKNLASHLNKNLGEAEVKQTFNIMNKIFHVIESILGQEELPEFYEDELPTIMEVCKLVITKEYPNMQ